MGTQNQHIQLISPVMDHIPTYVVENSACRACGGISIKRHAFGDSVLPPDAVRALLAKFTPNDLSAAELKLCECETPTQLPVVKRDQYKGKTVMICGSGPSLKFATRMIKRGETDHVWGCNDALMWLTKHGHNVTHGVGIDQSPDLYTECWTDPPDVPYLLATSVDPKLIAHLDAHGRSVSLFHSHIGFDGEHPLYGALYPGTALAGEGLNVVNRAIGVAEYMGYSKIHIAGADCAFTQIGKRMICMHCGVTRHNPIDGPCKCGGTQIKTGRNYGFHVHGDAVEGIVLELNPEHIKDLGRHWATKPDMLISAISLVNTKRRLGSTLEFVGNTLPKALQHKDQAFLDRCIRWASEHELENLQAEQAIQKWAPSMSNIKAAMAKG